MPKIEQAPTIIPFNGMDFVQYLQDFGVTLTPDKYKKVYEKLDKRVAALIKQLQPSVKTTQLLRRAKGEVISNLTNPTTDAINQVLLKLQIEEAKRASCLALVWKGINPTNIAHPQKLTIDLIIPELISAVTKTATSYKPRRDSGQISVLFGFLQGLDDASDFYTGDDNLWKITTSALLYPDRNINFPENPFLTDPFPTPAELPFEPELISYAQQMRSFGQRSVLRVAAVLYPQVVKTSVS